MEKKELTETQIKGLVRAFDDGVSLQALSMLFKLNKHEIINIIHIIKCVRKEK